MGNVSFDVSNTSNHCFSTINIGITRSDSYDITLIKHIK